MGSYERSNKRGRKERFTNIVRSLTVTLLFILIFVYSASNNKEQKRRKEIVYTLKSIREDAITGNIDTKGLPRNKLISFIN